MSRYTGSVYRKARRLGFSVTETGKEIAKRPNIPGQHGGDRGKKLSNDASRTAVVLSEILPFINLIKCSSSLFCAKIQNVFKRKTKSTFHVWS